MVVETVVIGGGLVAAFGAVAGTVFYTVDEKEEVIITSFGKHKKTTTTPGFKFKAPWHKKFRRVSKKMDKATDDLGTKTKDDIFVTVPITLRFRVTDSDKFTFHSEDPVGDMKRMLNGAIKQNISSITFEEIYSQREEIKDSVIATTKDELEPYGIELRDIIIDEPVVPQDVQDAYNAQKSSEKQKIARITNAEAKKEERIMDAEAQKEASRLLGEGIADQRAAIFKKYAEQINELKGNGIPEDEALKIMALAMQQDTLRDIGEKGNLIISTTNANDSLSEFQALGHTLTTKVPGNDNGQKTVAAPAHKGPKAPSK